MQGKHAAASTSEWVPPQRHVDVRARNVIVAAFDTPDPNTLAVLARSMPRGGKLTVVSQKQVRIPGGDFKRRWIKGHPASASAIRRAGISEADSLLIAGVGDWDDTDADMQVGAAL